MVFQIITILSAFYVVFIIYRKNFEYIGNKIFISSFFFFGLYSLVLFIYEFPISPFINRILLNSSLFFTVVAVLFFVLSMQTFIQGSIFLKQATAVILIVSTAVVFILIIIFPYEIAEMAPEVEANKNIVSLLAMGVSTMGFMVYNFIRITIALREIETSDKRIKKKIGLLWLAQLVGLLSPIMAVIGEISQIEIIYSLHYIFLGIPILIVGMSITPQKGKDN